MEVENKSKENEINTAEELQAKLAEELKVSIAEKVREESGNSAKLTSIDSLAALKPDVELEYIDNNLAEMAKSDDYKDIKSMVAPNGTVYLYSATFITIQYANILARVEANDKCATIAMTVRDDSKIYPRLTRIEYFLVPPFNIKPEELEVHIARTLEREEYKDIKLLIASTEVHYLFSDLYIGEAYAKTLMEWEEVEQYENP